MDTSVVVCTHRRAEKLQRTLLSVVGQAHALRDEILVVDNACDDETRALVCGMRGVRYLREERLGLCHARNRGWSEARGAVVAFLDDDVIAGPDWLAAVRSAFQESDESVGCIGGRVLPDWEAPPPAWLSHDVSLALAIVDWPGQRRRLTNLSAEWLAGANLACRVSALEAVGGFHPSLDRRGARLLSSGDVFLQKQMLRRGYACVFEPRMCVQHAVPAPRLTQRWFRRRYFWQGVSDALMEAIEEPPTVAGRVRAVLQRSRRLFARPRQLARLLRSTEDPRIFEEQCWTWIAVGHLAGLLGAGGR